ncbi:MAG: hypothetical protein EX260_03660, partial [Desulfobulbaceae bacterium]
MIDNGGGFLLRLSWRVNNFIGRTAMGLGYTGKILRVDLSSRELSVDTPSKGFYRTYMGGSALNLYYLLKEMDATVDALSPENILAFSVGTLTGARVSGQSRLTITAKSPLTGAIGDSQ